MSGSTFTVHGAELYEDFRKAGGSLERWREKVAPLLKAAGAGPLYSLSQQTYHEILDFARQEAQGQ